MRQITFYLLSLFILSIFASSRPAWASPILTGCSIPPTAPAGNVWYVDPVNGSMQGDGSAAHPWQTLAGVVAAGLFANMPTHYDSATGRMMYNNPSAPIQSGDTIYLMSGDHGAVTIQGDLGSGLVGYNNTSFITVTAAPGQTPILDQLTVIGGNNWVFRGLTIQGLNTSGVYPTASNGAPDVYLVQFLASHNNIIFDRNNVQSTTDVSSWSMTDWISMRSSGVRDVGGNCIAITDNVISNVGFGVVSESGTGIEIGWNIINYFSDDGIDYGSSNSVIQFNQISNSVEDGDGFHRDGIQGQPASETTVIENISISNNTIIRLLDPNLQYPGNMQGIDAFDGTWNFLTVSHNVVITDDGDGIAFDGANYLKIQNNILLQDSGKQMPCYNLNLAACLLQTITYGSPNTTSIMVQPAKSGAPSTNVTVSDNIVTGIQMSASDPSVTVSNNLCLLTGTSCTMGYLVNGLMNWEGAPGAYSGDNVISNLTPSGFFTTFDTTNMIYNLTPTQPNPAASS